jgi:moderate conductance mechanosensitive channel
LDEQIIHTITSLLVSVFLFIFARIIIQRKLSELKGSQKIIGIVSIGIVIGEIMYIGNEWQLFEIAFEVIASIGVVFGLLSIAMQSHLRNAIAGIGIYMNSQINIGDVLEVENKKGEIIEIHLTKTILLTDDEQRIFVPNLKFTESVLTISDKKA